jgi:hypothetical protein
MTLSTESEPSVIVNVDEVVFMSKVRFEKLAVFRMSKAAIESMKEFDPDSKSNYAALVEAPE